MHAWSYLEEFLLAANSVNRVAETLFVNVKIVFDVAVSDGGRVLCIPMPFLLYFICCFSSFKKSLLRNTSKMEAALQIVAYILQLLAVSPLDRNNSYAMAQNNNKIIKK